MLFFLLMNVKMPTIVGILTFMGKKFMLSRDEHEKSVITSDPGLFAETNRTYDGVDVETRKSQASLKPRQGNLRLFFRLFSLMRGLPIIRQTENKPEISLSRPQNHPTNSKLIFY